MKKLITDLMELQLKLYQNQKHYQQRKKTASTKIEKFALATLEKVIIKPLKTNVNALNNLINDLFESGFKEHNVISEGLRFELIDTYQDIERMLTDIDELSLQKYADTLARYKEGMADARKRFKAIISLINCDYLDDSEDIF